MLAIPVPFVVALALALLLVVALGRERWSPLWSLKGIMPLAVVQSVLVGLRWSFDLAPVRWILPITASLLPPLAWAAVDGLRREVNGLVAKGLAVTIVLGVLFLTLFWRQPIDIVLALIEAGYGLAILGVAMRNSDELEMARLVDVPQIRPILFGLGGLLIASAFADGFVALDFEWLGGSAAPAIVSIAGLITLAVLACIVGLIGRNLPIATTYADASREKHVKATSPTREGYGVRDDSEPDDAAVLSLVEQLMLEGALYRNADLTLEQLARRAILPARAVSAAINRVYRQNVSQFVNGFRVAEAQRLLENSNRPVTDIMFDAGFQTKSNFNREFRRVAGCSPTEWRHRHPVQAKP